MNMPQLQAEMATYHVDVRDATCDQLRVMLRALREDHWKDLPQRDIPTGDDLLRIGKYPMATYHWVLRHDLNYARWAVTELGKDNLWVTSPFGRFARWAKSQGVKPLEPHELAMWPWPIGSQFPTSHGGCVKVSEDWESTSKELQAQIWKKWARALNLEMENSDKGLEKIAETEVEAAATDATPPENRSNHLVD